MFVKTTESVSPHQHLEKMVVRKLLAGMNAEDHKVAGVIKKILPDIEMVVKVIEKKMKKGGRLFYIGSGTSGRLGIVDASECPPTYGVDHGRVIGIIAGGDRAIRKAVEFAEDDMEQGWKDLQKYKISKKDIIIGISASGTTPYVAGTVQSCNMNGIATCGITCNGGSPLAMEAKFPIVAVVGPEFVTGSTRMKAGTAQKLILNMISTSVMIRLGKVKGNKMVNMQLTNNKLIDRGSRIIAEELSLPYERAKELLLLHGSVRKTLERSGK
ncbi:MAG: N-acetylmuramic acid 6-phosphate etherase [Bacteroidetes bacterium]|nr:N-acetylmuramic acid 6-phosphate etherase [Bacteroidota bacterium]